MKRARPKQHTRRLKSGRVIKVNKGVKKKAKRKAFNPSTGTPIVDFPESFGYSKEKVMMSPDEYIKLAMKSHDYKGTQEEYEKPITRRFLKPFEEYYKEVKANSEKSGREVPSKKEIKGFVEHGRDRMDSIKSGLMMDEPQVPEVWLEKRDGKLVGQEGRHRAIAARELGYKEIPVNIVTTRKSFFKKKPDTEEIKDINDYFKNHTPREIMVVKRKKVNSPATKLYYQEAADRVKNKKKSKEFIGDLFSPMEYRGEK